MNKNPIKETKIKKKRAERPFIKSTKDFFYEFKKNKSALIGAILVILLIIISFLGPIVLPFDLTKTDLSIKLESPSLEHWFGTDQHGRDIFARVIHGLGITMGIGLFSTLLGGITGVLIGIISGYYGGKTDTVIMRFMDILLAFPGILLALAIISILGASIINVVYAVAISAIPIFARIARGSTLETKGLEYIDAMIALGASDTRIVFKHILPNISSPVIVQASLYTATAILSASGLSFLGLGAQPPSPELGTLLSDGRDYMFDAGHIALFPGIAIVIIVLAFNVLGDGFRDALDPKMRK